MSSADVRKARLQKVIRSLSDASPPIPLSPRTASNAAIVSTVKGVAAGSLTAWCSYHLAIGFEQIFLYFDDPSERAAFVWPPSHGASAHAVQVKVVDENQWSEWEQLGPAALEWLPRAEAEVQARQALNALHALARCVAAGRIAWLIHLDADELFYPGPSLDVRAHFASLGARGVSCLTYSNHEALPAADHHSCVGADVPSQASIPFDLVSLFKCNPATRSGSPSSCLPSATFNYYTNGKSVTRVVPQARPLSVHEYLPG